MEWNDFLRSLRSDLNHLYDPNHLRRSPLVVRFGLAGRVDAAFKLQKILVDAVESLQDASGSGRPVSPTIYPLLHSRYVLQLSQADLAEQLSMSVRQLRRDQGAAIEFLATCLWQQFSGSPQPAPAAPDLPAQAGLEASPWEGDLSWLEHSPAEAVCDPNQVLVEVVDLLQPLLQQYGLGLEPDIEGPLPLLSVHPVAVQQALLSILNAAVRASHGRTIFLRAWHTAQVEIQVSWEAGEGEPPEAPLALASRLLGIFAGRAELERAGAFFDCRLFLPVLSRVPVMVIDDNADFFQLLQRYAAGSRYDIQGIHRLDDVLNEIVQRKPGLILLDIMMPGIDGWELLTRIHSHPAIQAVPVIISTILPQNELAIARGASDFIQKPITRAGLLEVLDRQAARAAPAGR
jgi:CheY-like chemotaxis protein